jgi:hypothetical protein
MPRKFDRRTESLIASLRGLPEEDLPYRDHGAKGIGSLAESLAEKYHLDRRTPEETVQENWARIIGPPFTSRCRPERIDPSGTLVIQVPDATVRRELMFAEDRMLTVLGSLPDCHHIHRIAFKSGI